MAIEVPAVSGIVSNATSLVSSVVAPVAAAFKIISDPLSLLGSGSDRSIGDFVADVTMEESGSDTLQITEHPVEVGSTISDHAFKHPAEVHISVGWSDSGNGPGYCRAVYAGLLTLQAARTFIVVTTGKRVYSNMLIQSLSTVTTRETEYAIVIEIVLKQVFVVATRTVQIDPAKAANPADTAPVQQASPQQATPATATQSRSLLLRGAGGTGYSQPSNVNVRAGDAPGGI